MAIDSFAFLAWVAVIAMELWVGYRPAGSTTNTIAWGLLTAAVVLLMLAGHSAYFWFGVTTAIFGSGFLLLSGRFPPGMELILREDQAKSMRTHHMGRHLYRIWSVSAHAFSVYSIPVAFLWSVSNAKEDKSFFDWELGHYLVGGILVYGPLVGLPLFVLPKGWENPTLYHQKYEGTILLIFGVLVYIPLHLIHVLLQSKGLTAEDYDHEGILLIWAFSGFTAILLANQGIKTHIHGAFPPFCFYIMFQGHAGMGMDTDAGQVYMALHALYRNAHIVGALCRLMGRPVEATLIFFLIAWDGPNSPHWISSWYAKHYANPSYADDPDYHVAKVVTAIILAVTIMLYSVHVACAGAMRRVLEEDEEVKFQRLVQKDVDDTDHDSETATSDEEEGRMLF
ncbi:expressed unknown protein [Seminavis robusta]|uniref:Uncharacterized protein n=1 Tax=Seminavis robusta TaxID=568900 RepID=A0A9N8DZ88_9STRA|nr:expressed unknown protein [Seminavis robusta]|eukprot:Sro493_g154070.1 n/a (396) ;mRNA; f:27235-28523